MPTREAMHAALAPPLAASGDERHQQVLVVLRPRLIGAQLAAAFGVGPIEAAPAGALRCQVLDAKYLPGEQCTILYQLGDAMVVSTLAWGAADEEPAGSARVIAPLGMRAYLFPDDPALPSLAIARRPDVMTRALADSLPACRAGAARVLRCRVTPVRYRPGKRATL